MSELQSPQIDKMPLWFVVPFSIVAPTWYFADCLKRNCDRTRTIKRLNKFWLGVSVFSFFSVCFWTGNDVGRLQRLSGWPLDHPFAKPCLLLWAYLLWSRCTEIGFAFLRDAHDKIGQPFSQSKLRAKDRLALAFKSYIELICNFAILFNLCPADTWQQNAGPKHVTDLLYFSATTITTSGNGALGRVDGIPDMRF